MVAIIGLWALAGFLLYRNHRVYQFRKWINEMCLEWSLEHLEEESAYRWLYDIMPSYNDMMIRFWIPLKLKHWVSEDKCIKLLS